MNLKIDMIVCFMLGIIIGFGLIVSLPIGILNLLFGIAYHIQRWDMYHLGQKSEVHDGN